MIPKESNSGYQNALLCGHNYLELINESHHAIQINSNYHSPLFITELEGYKVSVWDISVWDLSVNATHPVYLYGTQIRPRMYYKGQSKLSELPLQLTQSSMLNMDVTYRKSYEYMTLSNLHSEKKGYQNSAPGVLHSPGGMILISVISHVLI